MKQQKKKYIVKVVNHCDYGDGSFDNIDKGCFETWAVSEKQAIRNISFRLGDKGNYPNDMGGDGYWQYQYEIINKN